MDHKHLNNNREEMQRFTMRDFRMLEDKYLHHTAMIPGYLPKTDVYWIPYSGRYGCGIVIFRHNPNSKRYALKDYWIIGEENDNAGADYVERVREKRRSDRDQG